MHADYRRELRANCTSGHTQQHAATTRKCLPKLQSAGSNLLGAPPARVEGTQTAQW
jgi:hypothetical protein